ncbi:MAG: TetR/AcrR family transcriptional regulator [Anaerolineales bacterium]|nr:TetR/AcrR family transcriptional regulator [Anaerolineales bacterium]MCB9171668.1 TetR/AcrR family transcriptional regulator [Ardenticatenales bacterium]
MKHTESRKERLFQTAGRLFYQQGYRAVGVDTIASEAGIGKMTLYRHYPSKDDLILAFLEASDREFWQYFSDSTDDIPSARRKMMAFFEGLERYVVSPDCFGCPFNNIASEFPDPDHSGHQISVAHKKAVRARFLQLADAAGAHQPTALADALLLLMDGAYMAARMYGAAADNPAHNVTAAAHHLIDAYCGTEE